VSKLGKGSALYYKKWRRARGGKATPPGSDPRRRGGTTAWLCHCLGRFRFGCSASSKRDSTSASSSHSFSASPRNRTKCGRNSANLRELLVGFRGRRAGASRGSGVAEAAATAGDERSTTGTAGGADFAIAVKAEPGARTADAGDGSDTAGAGKAAGVLLSGSRHCALDSRPSSGSRLSAFISSQAGVLRGADGIPAARNRPAMNFTRAADAVVCQILRLVFRSSTTEAITWW